MLLFLVPGITRDSRDNSISKTGLRVFILLIGVIVVLLLTGVIENSFQIVLQLFSLFTVKHIFFAASLFANFASRIKS